jgi:hypothetical protein
LRVTTVVLAAIVLAAGAAPPETPVDYVLARLATHRIVILGEGHRTKHEVQLVLDVLPRMPAVRADTLALEMFDVSTQPVIDRILASPKWDQASALEVVRVSAEMPYREYLEILHEAWTLNRGGTAFHVVALGPGRSWREELLPKGQTYETFMADRVIGQLQGSSARRMIVYVGAHHGFTRHVLSEMPVGKTVSRFTDRTGNILWRRYGDDVFFVYFHRPWNCLSGAEWVRCLPVDAAIDCAGLAAGHPLAFDTATSPLGETLLQPGTWYALGYAKHRLLDFADGYVWFRPVEDYERATLIPLSELAPDAASLTYVREHNFITDEKGLTDERLRALWKDESEASKDVLKANGWEALRDWRRACSPVP